MMTSTPYSPSRTSTELLAGLREPDNPAAWRAFWRRYLPFLLSCAKRMRLTDAEAQDAVQQALAVFVVEHRAQRYDRTKGRLKAWLAGVLKHKALHIIARRPPPSFEELASRGGREEPSIVEPAAADDFGEAIEEEWQRHVLGRAMDELRRTCDPDDYQTFDLYAIKGWPTRDVASFLGVSDNVVYMRKCKILKQLRDIIRLIEAEEDA